MYQSEGVKTSGKVEKPGDTDWTLTSGVSYIDETFSAGLGKKSAVGLQLGSRLAKVLNSGIRLDHTFQFIPAFNDFGNYYYISTLNVAMPVSGRMSLNLSFINDYDSTPAAGARKDNAKYGLTLGYKF
jgi:hypothetical protein